MTIFQCWFALVFPKVSTTMVFLYLAQTANYSAILFWPVVLVRQFYKNFPWKSEVEFCEKIKLSKGPLRLVSQHLFVGLDWDAEKNADFIVCFFFKHFHLVKKVAKKGRKYRTKSAAACFSSSPGHLCSEGHQGSFATGLAGTPNGFATCRWIYRLTIGPVTAFFFASYKYLEG